MLKKAVSRISSPACRPWHSSTRSASHDARPAMAPRQYPHLAQIRSNVEQYEENARVRNYRSHVHVPLKVADGMDRMADLNRQMLESRQKTKELQNLVSQQATDPSRKEALVQEIKTLQPRLDQLSAEHEFFEQEVKELAVGLPNLTSAQTPTDGEPRLIRYVNYDPQSPPTFAATADHALIGDKLALLDFRSASAASGWGFYYLLNEAALLEQALVQHALSVAMSRGWSVVSPPSLVYSHVADSCGFQPRDQNDEQQIWQVAQPARDAGKPHRSLAATAEIPLAAMHASRAIPAAALPIKLVGSSRCYRAEAGARGVDTKGLYRVHEFTKVEMFGWAHALAPTAEIPDEAAWTQHSARLFDEMVDIQTEILSSLDLPFRVLEMPSSDLGASAFRKIDIEALFPSRLHAARDGGWGEVTSASICTDYQSRRLDTRIEDPSGKRAAFAHTVNGTAMAVPRVLAAILENGWDEATGSVRVPGALRRYLGGMERIGPR